MIEIKNLTKKFKNVTAVNNLNLIIPEGVIFGFVGPNGAGKTTTIKMLATLLEPTNGDAFINGYSIVNENDKVKSQIGYMPDFFGVYDDMKVWEYLNFFASAYRIEKESREGIIDDVLALTDLNVKKDEFVDNLSRGMKQRLCLAKTLVHDPKVLLLDEPASGLDPRARIELRELLKELRSMGKTIFISSHILTELQDFIDYIGILETGELIVSGEVDSILEQIEANRIVRIKIKENADLAKEILEQDPDIYSIEKVSEKILIVEFSSTELEKTAEILQVLLNNGIKVLGINEEQSGLEDIFMKLTKGLVS